MSFLNTIKNNTLKIRPTNSRDQVRDCRDHHEDCNQLCLYTNTFTCVASEMKNDICYLYDDSFKMAFDSLAKSYFGEI